ncbi:MAG: T9SS type A sorting domain-containing protein [Bacteroidota bacterium]|jgi:hypothetical protein
MKPIKIILLSYLILIGIDELDAQSCTGYVTYTQGAWGAPANGNNIGIYLDANFSNAFPNGLEIGCTNKLLLTSATAIRNFLPQGTTPTSLPSGVLVDPTSTSYNNVLAGQLITLALNIGFDYYDSNFAPAGGQLKDLIIVNGTFANWTVQQLFDEANNKIGGCSNSTLSYSDFNNAINSININYDKGTSNLNFLSCQLSLSETNTNISCNGNADGSINLTVYNGQAPYSYQWSNGATTEDLSNLNAGTYTVTVTDNNGQTAIRSINLIQPAPIIISSSTTPISCSGGNNGSISLNVIGGDAPYTYYWNNGSSSSSINNLTAGTYQSTITDFNGCTASITESISEPDAIILTGTKTDSYVCDQFVCDGTAAISIIGGAAPYSTQWSDGSNNTNNLVNLCPTLQLLVTVTDNNGCTAVYDFMGIECKQCDTLTTYSQTTWGDAPNGNNLGNYLHANFSNAFPAGLTIGCNNMLTLTNAQAITNWLPKTGTPAVLPFGILTDDVNYNNGFAAQLVTAKLNVGFDAYDPNFNPSSDYLGSRYFISGLYAGFTVDQVIEEASNVIGGCVSNYLLAELNFALNAANLNYENGNHANGYLACRFIEPIRYSSSISDNLELKNVYPNPFSDVINAEINLSKGSQVKLEIVDLLGRVVLSNSYNFTEGIQKISINTKELSHQVYVLRFTNEIHSCRSMMMVK